MKYNIKEIQEFLITKEYIRSAFNTKDRIEAAQTVLMYAQADKRVKLSALTSMSENTFQSHLGCLKKEIGVTNVPHLKECLMADLEAYMRSERMFGNSLKINKLPIGNQETLGG